MKSGPSQPGQMEMSIGGERIPFTMQAEASQMTIEEAVASRLFDMPDEPGMVRIPISMNAMIPGHLLQPPEPEPTAGHDYPRSANGVSPNAPGSPPRRRFGNYPRGIAARNVMNSFRSQMSPAAVAPAAGLPAAVAAATGQDTRAAGEHREKDSFEDLIDADTRADDRGLRLVSERSVAAGSSRAATAALWPPPIVKRGTLFASDAVSPQPAAGRGDSLADAQAVNDNLARKPNHYIKVTSYRYDDGDISSKRNVSSASNNSHDLSKDSTKVLQTSKSSANAQVPATSGRILDLAACRT